MATTTKEQAKKKGGAPEAVQVAEKEARPLIAFFTKFNNDWSMNLSAALAYNLLMAIFPIIIAAVGILSIVVHKSWLTQQIEAAPPKGISASQIILPALDQLRNSSGFFELIAVILALWNGSRLFTLIEGCFGIIYHVRQRTFIPQNLMALGMLILFIILIPIMVVAAAAPTFVITLLQKTPFGSFPGSGILVTLGGIVGGILAAFALFLAIYIVVPNQKISFRHSWLGALVAAIALEIYLILFPLYATHFLGGLALLGTAVILLVFFYYFALILFIGAEVNAFFAEKIKATPVDLVTMVHLTTSHLPKSPQDEQEQKAASHRGNADGNISQQQLAGITTAARNAQKPAANANIAKSKALQPEEEATKGKGKGKSDEKDGDKGKGTASNIGPAIGAVAGTVLAFVIELVRLRRERPPKKRATRQVEVVREHK